MSDRPLRSLRLRQEIVPLLRTDPTLTTIGTPPIGQRVYGKRQPADLVWPFVRAGAADETPIRKGTQVPFTVHSFSKAQFDDECEQMNAAIQNALENATLDVGEGTTAYITWDGSQVIPDAAEADAWHGVNTFTATIG